MSLKKMLSIKMENNDATFIGENFLSNDMIITIILIYKHRHTKKRKNVEKKSLE